MSQTQKLLSNIHEYASLLSFLKDNHPGVLNEWKIKAIGPSSPTAATTDTNKPRTGFEYDTRDII